MIIFSFFIHQLWQKSPIVYTKQNKSSNKEKCQGKCQGKCQEKGKFKSVVLRMDRTQQNSDNSEFNIVKIYHRSYNK